MARSLLGIHAPALSPSAAARTPLGTARTFWLVWRTFCCSRAFHWFSGPGRRERSGPDDVGVDCWPDLRFPAPPKAAETTDPADDAVQQVLIAVEDGELDQHEVVIARLNFSRVDKAQRRN